MPDLSMSSFSAAVSPPPGHNLDSETLIISRHLKHFRPHGFRMSRVRLFILLRRKFQFMNTIIFFIYKFFYFLFSHSCFQFPPYCHLLSLSLIMTELQPSDPNFPAPKRTSQTLNEQCYHLDTKNRLQVPPFHFLSD